MCLSVMWQWADGASAARESVYFHKSQRSINTEGWLWGWLFSCQVCRVLKAAPTLCCSATRQGIPFHPARIHPITCQQGPLSSETGWKGTKKKKKHGGNRRDWKLTDEPLPLDQNKKEKRSSCCKNKACERVFGTCPGTLPPWWDIYLHPHVKSRCVISLGPESRLLMARD